MARAFRPLLLTLILVLAGCASPFDWLFGAQVHPPSWIQGTWSSSDRGTLFAFSPDNYVYTNDPDPEKSAYRVAATGDASSSPPPDTYSTTLELDLPAYRFDLSQNRKRVSVKETSSDTEYRLEVTEGSMTSTYTFKRQDATALDFSLSSQAAIRLTKQ